MLGNREREPLREAVIRAPGPGARNAMSRRTFMLAHWTALLFAIVRQPRHHGGKLLQHLRPTVLGAMERLFDPRLGDVEARMLEGESRPLALALRLEPEA